MPAERAFERRLSSRRAGATDIARLQVFFEESPEYFFAVGDLPPTPTEAHDEFHGELPEGWPFTKRWFTGFCDANDSLAAVTGVVSDLLAPGVWHIGLFIVATKLHGTGVAQSLYAALEGWIRSHGAHWLRLGEVRGNLRAERFWAAQMFTEIRTREGVRMKRRENTLRVLAKPLSGGSLEDYLQRVPRDRPGA
jgi:GNAT superfamily N-acetyltransferase